MKKLLFSFLVLISSRNYSQINTIKKDSILISNYLKLQKIKDNNSDILVVENKRWVNLIVKYNNEKQREINNIILEKFKKKSVSERFGENDINADSEIIEIIKQGNNDSINGLFADLKEYYNSDKPKNINSELKTLLFESINNPNLEVSASFLISQLKLEGFEEVLKNKLFSNTSKNESVLFKCLLTWYYCTDNCDDSTELIECFFNKLSNTTIDEIISNINLANALTSVADNRAENSKGRKKLNDFFFQLLDKYPWKNVNVQEDYKIIYDTRSIFDTGYNFYSVKGIISYLVFSGDSRIVPILKQLEGLGMKHTIQLDFLYWKYDYDKSEKTFDMLLSDREYYFKMIYELDKKKLLLNNEKMLKKVFDFFEIKPDLTIARNDVNYYQYYNYYDIKKMMEVFFKCNRDMFFNCINNTVPSNAYKNSYLPTNEDIKSSLKEDLESFKKFYEDKVLSNIYCYLMDQNFRKIQNNYLAKNENNYPLTNLTKEIVAKCDLLLNKFANTNSKIFSVFHNYSGDYDYDAQLLIGMDQLNLLRDNSRDELKNLTYFFDTKYIKNNDYIPVQPYEYNCYIHFNNAIYFFKINDKTNLEKLIINKLSKILLRKIKSKNQFIKLDFHKKIESDVYIFGIPENVNDNFNNFDIFN